MLSDIWVCDAGYGTNLFRILDPGVKKGPDPRSWIQIPKIVHKMHCMNVCGAPEKAPDPKSWIPGPGSKKHCRTVHMMHGMDVWGAGARHH